MTKESSLQTFPVNLFVEEAHHVVKILQNITAFVGITGYLSETKFW